MRWLGQISLGTVSYVAAGRRGMSGLGTGKEMTMTSHESALGGPFTFPGTPLTVRRMGYGAMQLAGPGVWGPPRDPDGAVAVLREAVAAGVNHIDTATSTARTSPTRSSAGPAPVPGGAGDRHQARRRRPPDWSWHPATGRGPDRGRPRQPPQPGPGRPRHRQLPRVGLGPRARGRVHRRAGDGPGRPTAPGADPPRRPEQRDRRAGG